MCKKARRSEYSALDFSISELSLLLANMQVNEVWTWNVKTYQWEFINTTYGTFAGSGVVNTPPAPRELHVTAYVEGNLYIFGGKSHILGEREDAFYGDLWRLHIEHAFPIVLSGADNTLSSAPLPLTIPQGQRLYLKMNASASPYSDTFDSETGIGSNRMCVNTVAVKVSTIDFLLCIFFSA